MPAFIDAAQVRSITFVRYVEVHDRLGSTNERAAELARDTYVALPALVVARLQTAGKGRGRNTWWAADGALTFSLLLDTVSTGVALAHWPRLSLATAVAVYDSLAIELERAESSVGIKWPNDVLIEGRKVCGILIESPSGAKSGQNRLIVGIGININNSWRFAPNDAGRKGTALCDISGRQHELTTVLVNLLNSFAARIEQLRGSDPALIHAWRALDLLRGKTVCVQTEGRRIDGDALEISDDGALVVNTPLGRQRCYSGSVRLMQ
jgi:BirA family biotin operon repressor/biotin-[acetyl-CoA-carboxylase] ligase